MSDTKKAPLDLVPLRALVGAARVFEHGNTKKDRKPGDFIKRELNGVFFASLMRHTMEIQALAGVVDLESLAALDADTDLPVIDHIICNALILRTLLIRDGLLPVDPGPGRRTIIEKLEVPSLVGQKADAMIVDDPSQPVSDGVPGSLDSTVAINFPKRRELPQ